MTLVTKCFDHESQNYFHWPSLGYSFRNRALHCKFQELVLKWAQLKIKGSIVNQSEHYSRQSHLQIVHLLSFFNLLYKNWLKSLFYSKQHSCVEFLGLAFLLSKICSMVSISILPNYCSAETFHLLSRLYCSKDWLHYYQPLHQRCCHTMH